MEGPGYIKAIKVSLHQILLNVTSGISLKNTAEFIKAGASIISVGSALVDKKAVMRKIEVLTKKAREFVEEIRKVRNN